MDEVIRNYVWVEQMKEAMNIMIDACYANKDLTKCNHCPFETYCLALDSMGFDIPEAWDNTKL